MNTYELFANGNELPQPLTKEETHKLFQLFAEGSEEAKEKLISHNIRLVLYEVTKKFCTVDYDKKDLASIGIFGLLKAVNTYDVSKSIEFATYATRCIDNEILMFLRKIKKDQNVDSLDRVIFHDKDGSELKLEDKLSDDSDLVEDHENSETYEIIRELVKQLPDRDKEIIMLHFGFYNDIIYTQEQIAEKFHISQSYVSRLIKKIVKKLGKQLESARVIERNMNAKTQTKTKVDSEVEENCKDELLKSKKGKWGKSTALEMDNLAEYLKSFNGELTAKELLEKTSSVDEFKNCNRTTIYYILKTRNIPFIKVQKKNNIPEECWDKVEEYASEGLTSTEIKGKMDAEYELFKEMTLSTFRRRLGFLKISTGDFRKKSDNKPKSKSADLPAQKQSILSSKEPTAISPVQEIKEEAQVELITKPESKEELLPVVTPEEPSDITKDDRKKLLEMLRTPTFTQMMRVLTAKESVIISLKLGYVDGKYFSTESIAQFLGIEETEVIETTKKVLLLYKENINSFIDNIIEVATDQIGQGRVLSMKQTNKK